MSTETTPAPAVADRQIGQLLAGRYRLSLFHGGDEFATVWRALDEATQQIVTLEILRDRGNLTTRQRFVADAHRLEQVQRPSVMRVSAVHDDAMDTFIVFEHLVPLPVVLTALEQTYEEAKPLAVATEPAVAEQGEPVPAPFAAAASTIDVPAAVVTQTAPELARPQLEPLVNLDPLINRLMSTPWAVRLKEQTEPYLEEARSLWTDIVSVLDEVFPTRRLSAIRAHLPKPVDVALTSAVSLPVSLVVAVVRRLGSLSMPHITRPHVSVPRVARAPRSPRAPRIERAARAPRAPFHFAPGAALRSFARRLVPPLGLLRLIAVGAVSVAVVSSPLDEQVLASLPAVIESLPAVIERAPSFVETIKSNIARNIPAESAAPATLTPAAFDVPPLSAYGAAFESQSAYPTASPNGAVEWVIALRNTGSAGWYRGIDGAQASLTLPDGTSVAVQSTPYVAPGQVGWFVARFRAPAEPGTYTISLRPRIDGRGELPDLGIHTVVTVTKAP